MPHAVTRVKASPNLLYIPRRLLEGVFVKEFQLSQSQPIRITRSNPLVYPAASLCPKLNFAAIGIPEYWVIAVDLIEIIAFEIKAQGSRRIPASIVLPELSFEVVQQALTMSRTQNQTEVGAWLMQQFQRAS